MIDIYSEKPILRLAQLPVVCAKCNRRHWAWTLEYGAGADCKNVCVPCGIQNADADTDPRVIKRLQEKYFSLYMRS